MNLRWVACGCLVGGLAFACSSSAKRNTFDSDIDPNAVGDGGGSFIGPDGGKGACGVASDPENDYDGDGFPAKLDCNECDPAVNPGAFDVAGNGIDEDCNGTADDEAADCDTGLSMTAADPFEAAKAMGLCKKADPKGKDWGVVAARYIRPDGTSASPNLDVGVLSKFGTNAPRSGSALLALSSGYARAPGDSGYVGGDTRDKGILHGAPAGYPKEFAGCPAGVITGDPQDGIGLELKIRVPTNAKSFQYSENFFTYEYSRWVCSTFNDFFVTMMDPIPAGLTDGNIAFDSLNNPISVNNGLLQVCTPGTFAGKSFTCPQGTAGLAGTGFENHAATGWLTTSAPVTAGEVITLQFSIWDSGDGNLDSTVLIDDFSFSVDGADGTKTLPSPPK